MHRSALLSDSFARTFRTILRDSANGDIRRLARIVGNAAKSRGAILADLGIHVPEMSFFSVTWQCNLECVGCYAKGLPTENNLSIDEIRRILLEMTACGTVLYAIAGGEPLSVPGLLQTLGRVEDGIFMVFTNGTLVDEQAVATIADAGNILPVISIEGELDQTDARRGDGTGAAVEEALDRLGKARVPFAYSTMVTHDNVAYVTGSEHQRRMWERGARFGFLVDYIPVPGSYQRELELTEEDLRAKRESVAARIREARPLLLNFPEAEYQKGSCLSAGAGFVHISATGDVEPCTFSHYATHNLRESTYLEALQSPFFQEIRRRFADRENPTGTCMLVKHEDEVARLAAEHGAQRTSPSPELVTAGD